jgi:hypothetical protein
MVKPREDRLIFFVHKIMPSPCGPHPAHHHHRRLSAPNAVQETQRESARRGNLVGQERLKSPPVFFGVFRSDVAVAVNVPLGLGIVLHLFPIDINVTRRDSHLQANESGANDNSERLANLDHGHATAVAHDGTEPNVHEHRLGLVDDIFNEILLFRHFVFSLRLIE